MNRVVLGSERIGLVGDLDGRIGSLHHALGSLHDEGIAEAIQLGDFGFVATGQGSAADLDEISEVLRLRGMTLYWIDGNHDDLDALHTYPVSATDGLRWVRPEIAHIPRGWRTTLAGGRTLAVMGGANSIDRARRQAEGRWWPGESITDTDLAALGTDHADILIGHNAPHLHDLRDFSDLNPDNDPTYAMQGQRSFERAVRQVTADLVLSAHWHQHLDAPHHYTDATATPRYARVVVFDHAGRRIARNSLGVLHPRTLDVTILDPLTPNSIPGTYGVSEPDSSPVIDEEVLEITDDDTGRWRLLTEHSTYLVALDDRQLIRVPGPQARYPTVTRLPSLTSIVLCRVGHPAQFLFNNPAIPRITTTPVVRIERFVP